MTHATLENQDMGRVLVSAKVENLADVWDREKGDLPADAVRSVEVNGALVDTGCTLLGLPRRMIDVLGLTPLQTRQIRTATGLTEARLYNSVRLTIQDRICNTDVMEIPDT